MGHGFYERKADRGTGDLNRGVYSNVPNGTVSIANWLIQTGKHPPEGLREADRNPSSSQAGCAFGPSAGQEQQLLELDHPAMVPTAVANVQTVAWLLSETSWRGMSTCLQLTSPPLHVQTLTGKWWISTPAPLRLGPAESLLRCLSECADNLDRFWQSVVGRMNQYGFYFVDPRLITIEFRGGGEVRQRRRAND